MKHDWIKSTLGHGETMCRRCGMTNREAAVLGYLDECDGSTQPETEVIPNQRPEQVNRKPRSADKTQPGAATGESQTAPGDVMSEDVLKAISFLRNDAHDCVWIADLIERLARERNCYRNDAMRDRSRLRKAEAILAQVLEADVQRVKDISRLVIERDEAREVFDALKDCVNRCDLDGASNVIRNHAATAVARGDKPCPLCRPSGQVRESCPLCEGFGWITKDGNPTEVW